MYFQVNTLHPCLINNGDCEHFCVPSPRSFRQCICATGFKLDSGGRKCTSHASFMLIAMDGGLKGISFDKTSSEAISPVGGKTKTSDIKNKILILNFV